MSEKKVLIISYYWPPSGGSGVQRWLKMAKYLPEQGWEPIVYTPENPGFGLEDSSLMDEKAQNIKVIKTKIWDPGSFFNKKSKKVKLNEIDTKGSSLLYKLMVWIRGNLFIPDSKIFWVKPSIRFLNNYLSKNPVDVVITTGPPHSMHLIGLGLKKALGIKWIADFRDPWAEGDLLFQLSLSKWAFKQHQLMERNVINNADRLIAVGNRLGESLLGDMTDETRKKLVVITNGYDEEDFHDVPSESSEKGKFVVTYSGLLYNNRNPSVLWETLDALCRENEDFKLQLEVNIAGKVDEKVMEKLKKLDHLYPKIGFLGYLPHKESISVCRNSNVLVLPVDNTKNGQILIPGKLFEYLACNVPILGFGNSESDANTILKSAGHDPLIPYDSKDVARKNIEKLYLENASGKQVNTYTLSQFSRRNLAGEVAKVLDILTHRN